MKYKLPIKVVIIKNNTLGQIKWEQMVFLGNPEYGVDLQPIDFAAFAHACGGVGFTAEEPGECGDEIERFLNAPGPAILQAVVDPFEPPLPATHQGRAGTSPQRVADQGRTQSHRNRAHNRLGQSSGNGMSRSGAVRPRLFFPVAPP